MNRLDYPDEPVALLQVERAPRAVWCCSCSTRIEPDSEIVVSGSCAFHPGCFLEARDRLDRDEGRAA